MENKDLYEKMKLDAQDLDAINGGMSEDRKERIKGYVQRFKARGYELNGIRYYWQRREENAGLSAAELDEDLRFIESIY